MSVVITFSNRLGLWSADVAMLQFSLADFNSANQSYK
jgi:hypothetical protein